MNSSANIRKVLLTGGSGDLGSLLACDLDERGDLPINLDLRPPIRFRGIFREGSILDRALLEDMIADVDCIVHIAAWHGLHEFRQEKTVDEFWELNIDGTYYVFEAAARAGGKPVVFLSSTSVEERDSIYGHTKVLGEEVARTYAARHAMNVITLRPRAFIPHWNRTVYPNYVEWLKWFWGGAVHIDDVVQATLKSIDLAMGDPLPEMLTITLDSAYEYTDDDLATWDATGGTFRKYYADYEKLARQHGLDISQAPKKQDISAAVRWLEYAPHFSLKHALAALAEFGEAGPPPPEF